MALTLLYITQPFLLWLYCHKITPQPCNLLQGRVVRPHTAMPWFKLFVPYFWWEFPRGVFNIELDPCCLEHGHCVIWLNSTWSNSMSILSLSLFPMRGIQAMPPSAFPIFLFIYTHLCVFPKTHDLLLLPIPADSLLFLLLIFLFAFWPRFLLPPLL